MARLDDVVGAILRDLTLAQDVASKHTRMLAIEYANDPLLRHFPVPRTQLEGVELELRFAPKQLKRVIGSTERTLSIAKESFDRYAPEAAHALLDVASERLERARAMPSFPAAALEEARRNLVSPDFEDYVTKAISTDLFANRNKLVTPPDGLDIDGVQDTTIATAGRVVFEHEDLKRFMDANPKFTSDTLDIVRDALKTPLENLRQAFRSSDLRAPEYELEVTIDPTELDDAPAHAYSTIRIRADLRNHRWVTSPNAPDQLVEEG